MVKYVYNVRRTLVYETECEKTELLVMITTTGPTVVTMGFIGKCKDDDGFIHIRLSNSCTIDKDLTIKLRLLLFPVLMLA